MLVDARKTTATDWRYVSEGGATIVFSYTGAESDPGGMVLRLRKAPVVEIESIQPPTNAQAEDSEFSAEPDDPTILFQSRVTSHLVPPAHLPRLVSCRVSHALLSSLSVLSNSLRPPERTRKDAIDTRKRRAVLATDLIGHDALSFAVEIKPKWAFLPNTAFLSPETRDVKAKYGRFVMHSYYRTTEDDKDQDATSTYDPLELFSGDEKRVRTAVEALWDSWVDSGGAANNLKIFIAGKTIRPSQPETLSLAESLQTPNQTNLPDLREVFTTRLTQILVHSPILPLLRTLQSSLDPLDIEGLDAHWRQYHSEALGHGQDEPSLDEWERFVATYNTNSVMRSARARSEDVMSEEELRYYILAYLMSATFKDCSIIIDMRADGEEKVKVIDLDPKSVQRLEKWKKLDSEIALAYANHVAVGGA